MKPWIEIGRARVEGAGELTLRQRDNEFVLRIDGEDLMSSRLSGSEEKLAELGCGGLAGGSPRVLIGGLGLGFTLRSALAVVGPKATVVIAELSPAVVEWNRTVVGHVAGHPLDDPRVTVHVGDVGVPIRSATAAYDAILLDVDNSPDSLCHPANDALYSVRGLASAWRALRPGGRFGVWSVQRVPAFIKRLAQAGFDAESHPARARGARGGATHTIHLGRKRKL